MRNPKTGDVELRAIAEREHLPLHVAALDVDSDESVRNVFAKILAEAGRIDVLVNNAGISGIGPVEENPIAAFRATMETNYFGALRCIQAVLPGMRERRSGCIVNVTSVAGRLSVAPQAAYSSSKFALEAASESLAQEVKASARCNRLRLIRITRMAGVSTSSSGLHLRILFLPMSWGKRSARSLRVAPGN
jgi:NAD(P)-dependent dehydrogenase (short-subunit alcohol dehydrogenase family)